MINPYGWTIKEAFGDVKRVNYFFWGVVRNVAPYLATPLSLLSHYLRQEGCCRILCQEYEYSRFDLSVLLGRLINIPVYATFQGGDFQISHFEKHLRPLSLRTCAGLIIPSDREIERVKRQYGLSSEKIARIFNPLNLTQWEGGDRNLTRLNLNISPNAQVVVWHGRIDFYRKGLDILLAAWKQVYTQRPDRDLKLLLVGTGDSSSANLMRQQISQMELQGIIWIDQYILDRSLIRDYLVAADVYTLASRQEGFPVAPLEAMACGLPIVATNAHGIPEILEGGELSGGVIVNQEDSMALAVAIGHILDNDKWRQELGQRARQRIETHFSLKAVGLQLQKFLQL